jgi:hypothetical protein
MIDLKFTTAEAYMADSNETLVSNTVANLKGVPTEAELIKLLQETTQIVTFKKLDGDERVMTCTKSFDIIPEQHQPKTQSKPKEGVITVWDTNAQGWRSFRYDRVKSVDNC